MGLNPVVEDVLELLAYQLRVDSVEVRLDLTPDLPGLWADPHQLHQVLVTLITVSQKMRSTSALNRSAVRKKTSRSRAALCVSRNSRAK